MSVTFISYRHGDADYTTHTLHALDGATQSGQTQVVELITIGGVTYSMLIDSGTSSTNGLNGWTPVLAAYVDGDRTLLRVSDWTGGGGTKPATGLFIGASGFVADMAQAVSVRGPKGDAGDLAELADGAIAKAKLSTAVQASLAKADSSVQDLVGMTTKATAGTAEQKAAHRDALGLGPIAAMTLTEAQSAVSGAYASVSAMLVDSARHQVGNILTIKGGEAYDVVASGGSLVGGDGVTQYSPVAAPTSAPYVARSYTLHPINTGSVNHAALQLALDRCAEKSGAVQLDFGTYAIAEDIVVPSDAGIVGRSMYRWWGSNSSRLNMADGKSIIIGGHRAKVEDLVIGGVPTSIAPLLKFDIIGGTKAAKVSRVGFDGGGVQQLDTSGAIASVFEDIILVNGLALRNSFTGHVGAVVAGGTDNYFSRIESNATSGFSSISPTGFASAFVVSGTNNFISNCIGELSDSGIVFLSGSKNRVSMFRADLNFGHGCILVSGDVNIAGLDCINNAKAGADTYCGMISTGASFAGNAYGIRVINDLQPRLIYAVDLDTLNGATPDFKAELTQWSNVLNVARTNNFLPATLLIASRYSRETLAAGATSVSAAGVTRKILSAASAVSISTISGGYYGQEIEIISASANITIVNGAGTDGIFMRSAANLVFPGFDRCVRLRYTPRGGSGGRWVEI